MHFPEIAPEITLYFEALQKKCQKNVLHFVVKNIKKPSRFTFFISSDIGILENLR